MAKAKPQVAHRRRGLRELDTEQWNRIFIIGGVVAVILIALGVIGYGWYQTQIKPLGKTVLRVEDTKYSLGHLVRRMELERQENPTFAQVDQGLLQLPDLVLDRLELEGKLLAAADELNITVTDEEVANKIKEQGNLAEDVEASAFATEFRRQVKESGLKEHEYRQKLKADLLQEKVLNYFTFLAPQAEPQVRGRWIVSDDQQKTEDALERLKAGEDWGTVSADVSLAGGGGPGGGELDWMPRGGSVFLPRDAQDFLFEAEKGELSGIIESGNLLYIVQLFDRDEQRPVTDQQKPIVGGREMFEWLSGLNTTLDITRDLTDDDRGRALDEII